MAQSGLSDFYRDYIDCLNRQDWSKLHLFVHDDVRHNGKSIGLAGYRAMLEKDFREIPDLRFAIETQAVDPPWIACRLHFECTPTSTFLGLPVNGRRVSFTEHVFYEIQAGRIFLVWSIIDKAAIEAQLQGQGAS